MAIVQQIQQIYIGLLGRAADQAGLDYWTAEIEAGTLTIEELRANIVNEQPEYAAGLGQMTRAQVVAALYQNLFERAPEADGLEYWVNGDGKNVNIDQLVLALISGASAADTLVLDNKTTAAIYYTTQTGDAYTEDGATAAVANVDGTQASVDESKAATDSGSQSFGKTFTLTVGEDSGPAFTGGAANDTFNAPVVQDNIGGTVNTLENIDVLDGGDGTDTLNATLSGANAAPILNSIENINVRFASANSLDLANATGVTSVTVQNSTAGGTVSAVGTIANLAVKNQTQDATFTGNTATTLALTLDTVGKSTALNTVAAANVVTTLNLTANNAYVTVGTLASVETLTIAATGKNVLDLSATDATVTTATITGAGSVDLSAASFTALKTLTATDNTGGVTIEVDAAATKVNTGSGDDSVEYVGALAATAAVDLGAGDDTFTIAAASVDGAVVNGGEGNDTLAVTNGAWLDATAKDVYTGFETLEIGGGTATYDMDNLPGLTAVTVSADLTGAADITNAAAGTTVTVNADGADLSVTSALTYALKTATGKTDAVTLTLAGTEDTTADNDADGEITMTAFDADGIETFNIVSNISGFEVEAGNGLKNTDYTHTITDLDGDAVQTINISGNANLTVTTLSSTTVTKINASTATGEVSIDASGVAQAVEFLGGSANDTYTGTAQGDTINAGAGADAIALDGTFASIDTLIFEAGDSKLTAKADGHDAITAFGTATGGGALDIIDLGAFGFTGQQASALANKGAVATSVVDGTTLTQADFFLSGGVDRGVAIGTNGGNTYVFVDVNKDGDFNAADDLFIELTGVTDVTLSNFGF